MYGFDLICSSFYLSKSGHFWICSSFSQHNDTYSAIDYNWKKRRWCAWDSNPGPQDVRRRRIHWAMASPSFLLPLPLISHECSTSTASLASSSYCCAPHPSIVRTYVRRWVVIRAHVSHTRVSEFRRLIRGERNWEQSLSHQAEAAHNNFPSANDDEETGAAKHTSTILSLSLSLSLSRTLSVSVWLRVSRRKKKCYCSRMGGASNHSTSRDASQSKMRTNKCLFGALIDFDANKNILPLLIWKFLWIKTIKWKISIF